MKRRSAEAGDELARLRALYQTALEIRDGHYSTKTNLEYQDRKKFDRFYQVVDAIRFGGQKERDESRAEVEALRKDRDRLSTIVAERFEWAHQVADREADLIASWLSGQGPGFHRAATDIRARSHRRDP